MESKKTPTGTSMTVFHTDLTLALRASASGESVNTLQLAGHASNAASDFRELLMTWDRHLPWMLERNASSPSATTKERPAAYRDPRDLRSQTTLEVPLPLRVIQYR